jgi:hypothetical protein
MALKDNAGNTVSPKRYAQIKLYAALQDAYLALAAENDLTEKQKLAVDEQAKKLVARAARVFGFGKETATDGGEQPAEEAAGE